MIALRVKINGGDAVVGGVQGDGVVSAIITHRTERGPSEPADTSLDLGGLNSLQGKEFLAWIKSQLKTGDKIQIDIIEATEADEPTERRRDDPEVVFRARRGYLERLKKELGDGSPTTGGTVRRWACRRFSGPLGER